MIVTADTLTVDPTSSFNTTADLILQPLNAATSIGLGTGSGTFNLTDAELDTIGVSALPSEVIIGRSNGAHTIDVNNTTPLNPTTYMFRGNGISVDNFDIVANPLNLNIGQLGAGIANIGNTITSGTITVTGNGTADNNTLQAQDIVNTWNVTSNDTGNVNGAWVIDFTNVGNLVGGTNDDTFVFADGAGTSGLIDGGAPAFTNSLDYTNFTTPAIVQFIGPFDGIASNIGGGFFNICCLIGNTIAPPVHNVPITFQNQVDVELTFKYLFLEGKQDDFYTIWADLSSL